MSSCCTQAMLQVLRLCQKSEKQPLVTIDADSQWLTSAMRWGFAIETSGIAGSGMRVVNLITQSCMQFCNVHVFVQQRLPDVHEGRPNRCTGGGTACNYAKKKISFAAPVWGSACHSSSVMKGMKGCASRSTVSKPYTSTCRVCDAAASSSPYSRAFAACACKDGTGTVASALWWRASRQGAVKARVLACKSLMLAHTCVPRYKGGLRTSMYQSAKSPQKKSYSRRPASASSSFSWAAVLRFTTCVDGE